MPGWLISWVGLALGLKGNGAVVRIGGGLVLSLLMMVLAIRAGDKGRYGMARAENYTPFTRRVAQLPAPMRVLHRFTKPGGHVAEIRERTVTAFKALEWLVSVETAA